MNSNIRRLFFYSMMALLGMIFLILGAIFKNDSVIFHRMIIFGFAMLGVGILFFLVTFKVQSNEKTDKALQRINNAAFDERNQFIAAKSSSITLDVMMICSLLAYTVFTSLGMNIYGNIVIGYIVISSILRIGVSIYLRRKF